MKNIAKLTQVSELSVSKLGVGRAKAKPKPKVTNLLKPNLSQRAYVVTSLAELSQGFINGLSQKLLSHLRAQKSKWGEKKRG